MNISGTSLLFSPREMYLDRGVEDSLDERVREVGLEAIRGINEESFENIPEFVERFNRDFMNRAGNRKRAAGVLRELREKAWKMEDGGRLIPDAGEVVNARNAFYELYKCDDAEIKEIALEYLIDILECDPMTVETAYDLVDLQRMLLGEIRGEKAQNLTTKLQRILIKAFALSLECILIHNAAGNLNALLDDTKNEIWDGASALGDFNVVEDEEIRFWVEYAVQGAQNIKSNVSEMKQWLWRIAIIAKAGVIVAAVSQDTGLIIDAISTIVGDVKEAFSHVTWRKSWFKYLLMLRKLTRYSLLDGKAFNQLIPVFQKIKQEGKSDLVMYGVVSTIEFAVTKSPVRDIQEEGIKLLLQFATYDDANVQKRVVQALFETLKGRKELSNTGFVVLKLLEASGVIKNKQIFQELESRIIDTSKLYGSVIKFLLRRLADIKGEKDYGGHSYVTLLCSSPNPSMIPRLLKALAVLSDEFEAPDIYGFTPYHIAAREGHLLMIKHTHELLNVDIDAQDYKRKNTALHLAVECADCQTVGFLLKCGANPNIENWHGNTPLHLAVKMRNRKVAELLLLRGASTRPQNYNGKTALNYAINQDDVFTVDLLQHYGAKIAESVHDFTPITVAARGRSEETLMYLIERKKEELEPLEALEITRMITKTGKEISASKEFCLFHLRKLEESELYRKAFEVYQNLPRIFLKGGGVIGVETMATTKVDSFGNTALITSARRAKSLNKFSKKAQGSRSVNRANYFGITPLHAACIFKNYHVIEQLLEARADIYATDIRGFTPLHFAAFLRDERLIQILLNAGANARAKNDYGDSPLHILCGNFPERTPETFISITKTDILPTEGDVTEMAGLLIQAGASPEIPDALGNNVLHHAAVYGDENTIRFLMENYPNTMWKKNKKGLLPIQEAALSQRHLALGALLEQKSLKELHEQFAEKTGNKITLGNQLANTRASDVFERLLIEMPELAVYPDATPLKLTPLHVAAQNGRISILEVYIKWGADLNIRDGFGGTAAHLAALTNNVDFLRRLKGAGADFNIKNRDGRTPLHLATAKNHCEAIDFLVKNSQTTIEQDGDGSTPLHIACKFKQMEAVQMLCKATPKAVEMLDDDMNTPLHHACHAGDWTIVQYLVEKMGAYVEARNIFGETPFIIAALHGFEETLGYLKLVGANFRAQDGEGESALHKAVFNQHLGVIKQLLPLDEAFPQPPGMSLTDLSDVRNETPLHELARIKRETDRGVPEAIMHELLKGGASVDTKNEKGETFLHLVCKNGLEDLFMGYLNRLTPSQKKRLGIFRTIDHENNTLLHKAVEGNSILIIEMLLDLGHAINPTNKEGQSPLLLAVELRHYKIARLLLKAQAKMNRKNKAGSNYLHIILGHPELTGEDLTFMEEGLKLDPSLLNKRDERGNTPLHTVAEHGHIGALPVIFKYLDGTDQRNERFIWKKNDAGQTAQEIAEQRGFFELEQKIRNTSKDQLGQ